MENETDRVGSKGGAVSKKMSLRDSKRSSAYPGVPGQKKISLSFSAKIIDHTCNNIIMKISSSLMTHPGIVDLFYFPSKLKNNLAKID